MNLRWLIAAFNLGADQLIETPHGILVVIALLMLGYGIKAGHTKSAFLGATVLVLLTTLA
ncbi:hypothetical protein K4B79_23625 [Streptomyces lincolnensis]|uniref:hypothetical protein n=1 Tax=Streptomyces lincolnensis TaxID=1915 RepID=UPI001E55A9C5|nr:hypothetical protein [Streptomyces lincolnensis]MCD7441200.1 hypothetical protein [Streptomyces lincolnensis]